MAMTPESNPLRNFHLPPRLRWGTQRQLRCKKSDEGIEEIGEKLMMDFKVKIDKISNERVSAAPVVGLIEGCESESSPTKPWNLRVRRSSVAQGDGDVVVERRYKKVRVFEEEKVVKKLRVRLEREEIEKDFVAMGGIKLPRRPKKRPRAIQRTLDTLFPGLGLNEVNVEMYAVREAP